MIAAQRNQESMLKLLLEHDANLNAQAKVITMWHYSVLPC